jgi:hypothetical protein
VKGKAGAGASAFFLCWGREEFYHEPHEPTRTGERGKDFTTNHTNQYELGSEGRGNELRISHKGHEGGGKGERASVFFIVVWGE